MAKLVIFDMDGVILDSMPSWYNCAYQVLHSMQNDFVKGETSKIKKRIWERVDTFDESNRQKFLDDWYSMMDQSYDDVKLKDYVKEYLEYLKSKNIKMVVATTTPLRLVKEVLGRFDLIKYFDFLYSEDEIHLIKHDGSLYEYIQNIYKIDSKDIVVIEDNLTNIKMANKLGMHTVGVYEEVNFAKQELVKNEAKTYIHSLRELDII